MRHDVTARQWAPDLQSVVGSMFIAGNCVLLTHVDHPWPYMTDLLPSGGHAMVLLDKPSCHSSPLIL
jgi:hypothetical protein